MSEYFCPAKNIWVVFYEFIPDVNEKLSSTCIQELV